MISTMKTDDPPKTSAPQWHGKIDGLASVPPLIGADLRCGRTITTALRRFATGRAGWA